MSGNIKARETLIALQEYPQREYPEPEDPNDKAKGGKKDAKPPPKKKKKKEPPFPIPEWATELEAVISKVKNMEQLVGDKVNLKLDDEFCTQVSTELARFKKEIAFRKVQLEEAEIERELKALKKSKKKG
jgi:hypothetical protein